jgi:hypothetical protein
VLQFVCCVFGVIPNAKTRRFRIWGVRGSSQLICCFCVSAMHLLSRCSALGPGPGSLPRPSSSPSSRTWPYALFAPHSVPCGTAWHSGAPGVLRRGVGALLFFFFRRDPKKKFEGNAITFLIPRTTLSFFLAILTTHRRTFFRALAGLLRPGALASIGLGGGLVALLAA